METLPPPAKTDTLPRINRQFLVGVSAMAVVGALGAIYDVFTAAYIQAFHPIHLMLYMFSMVTVASLARQLLRWRAFSESVLRNWRTLLGLSTGTGAAWAGLIFALKYLEPAIASLLAVALVPVMMTIGARRWAETGSFSHSETLASFGILFCSIFLAFTTFSGQSAVGGISAMSAGLGLLSTVVCACGGVACLNYSKGLANAGFSTDELMAVKYIVPLLLTLLVSPQIAGAPITGRDGAILAVLSVGGLIIPTILIQISLRRLSATTVAIISGWTPIIAYFLQSYDARLLMSVSSLCAILACTAFVTMGVMARAPKRNTA